MKKFKPFKIAIILGLAIFGMFGVSDITSATSSSYEVQPGDTLWNIANEHQIKLNELIQANPSLSNPSIIQVGQTILIPRIDAPASFEQKVIDLTNVERAKAGMPALTWNQELSNMARLKSQDMMINRYFDHQSPTYGSPFEMMRSLGISYTYAGENIAAGQQTPEEVVRGWMNSPGHRANILNPNYTQIGVGLAQGGSYGYYWTQAFIRP